MGTAALAVFAFSVLIHLRRMSDKIKESPFLRRMAQGIFIIWLFLMIEGFSQSTIFVPRWREMFALVLGFYAAWVELSGTSVGNKVVSE